PAVGRERDRGGSAVGGGVVVPAGGKVDHARVHALVVLVGAGGRGAGGVGRDGDDAGAGPRAGGAVGRDEGLVGPGLGQEAGLEVDAEGRVADVPGVAVGRDAGAVGACRRADVREVLGRAAGEAPVVALANGDELLAAAHAVGVVHGQLERE